MERASAVAKYARSSCVVTRVPSGMMAPVSAVDRMKVSVVFALFAGMRSTFGIGEQVHLPRVIDEVSLQDEKFGDG